ncbi:MAG TPA: ATP-binding protein [Tepidisphaeraceae bacterium]|nr:ATP-binding protein [Tepidisphaeraceae bacterium]
MRSTNRLISGAMALAGCGVCCTAAGAMRVAGSACGWGWLAALFYFGAMTVALAHALKTHRRDQKLKSELQEHEAVLRPGVASQAATVQQAVRSLLEASERAIADAALKARELEIQLKVAHAERQHAEAIIYSISDAVLVTDTFDELVLANESAARTFEFDLTRSGHLPVDQVLRDPRMISLIREMRQANSKSGRRIIEHRVRTNAGDRTFKITLSTVADGESPAGVVAVLHDMTREKEVSEMKNDFVSMVSHELRTPLASIKAYIEMLIDGEADDQKTQTEFYEVIQNEANRLGRLIDNILNISRIESGLVRVNKQPQSLAVILKDAIEVIAPQAKQKNITVTEKLTPVLYQTLADRDMLYQAVLNLLSNAVKYTPKDGSITVETSVDEAQKKVLTKIIDTGVGIPPKDLPFVFDKFYRAESNNRMAPGSGLGLSLVRHIVETVHHGRMFVESHVGKGSCFGFELDLCE